MMKTIIIFVRVGITMEVVIRRVLADKGLFGGLTSVWMSLDYGFPLVVNLLLLSICNECTQF